MSKKAFGHYNLKRKIGCGTFGKVYLATKKSEKDYDKKNISALKVLKKYFDFNSLENEFKIGNSLKHPNLIELKSIDSLEDKNGKMVGFIEMEFAKYGDFFSYLALSPFPEKFGRVFFTEILQGVKYMHSKNMAHCDLKPENIFVSSTWSLKLGDFGMVKKICEENSTTYIKYNGKNGTVNYFPPDLCEQYTIDKIDFFSLGVILFIIHFCCFPFDKDKPLSFAKMMKSHNFEEIFWNRFNESIVNNLTNELKTLIIGLLNPQETRIFDFEDIRIKNWLDGEKASKEEINKEMKRRSEEIHTKEMTKESTNMTMNQDSTETYIDKEEEFEIMDEY